MLGGVCAGLARTFGIDMRHHFGSSRLLDADADISRLLDD